MTENRISTKEFNLFREFIYQEVGISLSEKKIGLVQSRLSKRLKALNLPSFKDYYEYLIQHRDDDEMFHLISAISTNVTSFFREEPQWNFLRDNLNRIIQTKKNKKIRIWSAACSSGEEPYSIAMFLKDHLENYNSYDIKILATDISKKVLEKAVKGCYSEKDLQGMPKYIKTKHFSHNKADTLTPYKIKQELQNQITFRMFNLIYDDFKIFRNKFDFIFCRNVMIYFDGDSQKQLVSNYHKILVNNGLLFIGHSESLTRNNNEFKTVRPSIYERI